MDELSKDTILHCLQTGELILQGQFIPGSNYTLLVEVSAPPERFTAVYKPVQGETPLWDFEFGSLEKREVAAYLISEALGWELVPPVVYRNEGPLGAGSLQIYIDHNPDNHYFNFTAEMVERLRPAVVFDLLINNADRKGGHFLIDKNDHIWLIDHGLCFHQENKLRTVVWDFAGTPIPDDLLEDMRKLLNRLEEDEIFQQNLSMWISPAEIEAMHHRGSKLIKKAIFPVPDRKQRQFPWPPV